MILLVSVCRTSVLHLGPHLLARVEDHFLPETEQGQTFAFSFFFYSPAVFVIFVCLQTHVKQPYSVRPRAATVVVKWPVIATDLSILMIVVSCQMASPPSSFIDFLQQSAC